MSSFETGAEDPTAVPSIVDYIQRVGESKKKETWKGNVFEAIRKLKSVDQNERRKIKSAFAHFCKKDRHYVAGMHDELVQAIKEYFESFGVVSLSDTEGIDSVSLSYEARNAVLLVVDDDGNIVNPLPADSTEYSEFETVINS